MRAQIKKTRKYFQKMCFLSILAALFLSLLTSGCRLPDQTFYAEYFGTTWECSDPYAVFEVDDEGFSYGTLVYEEATIPVSFLFHFGNVIRAGRAYFIAEAEDATYYIFMGKYKMRGDTMVITGTWSEYMETIYHQPYDPGECTLIFKRRQ